ncbi:hypothetical protein AX774_g6370 [Zancudomyces culisetae]|uniref:Uncharacterized protein n=1 Tax=Zancudomyces culisetae TaxID=1213189 RepID=A0A1R1PGU8_ZANCU|nr:hypothetical protein AX774_g6370 [Zancudomyces culisetae]|eukprot:OMH80200.1 hypothetical protein AX774_g6370 [Zancudomyces culisetae]
MVNILLTTAVLIASKLVAGASIPDTQTNISKRQDDDNRNICYGDNKKQYPNKFLNIEMFAQRSRINRIGFKTINPNRCYVMPTTGSCLLNGGTPGEGTIMFCTGTNCDGYCRAQPRQVWYTPGDMQKDIGGLANSVYWTI